MTDFSIAPAATTQVSDRDLEDLLKRVYVVGGFTDASVGEVLFRAADVRARGDVLVAQDAQGNLIGTGARRMILWTQPSMEAAQLLYSKHGFERVPELDFSRGERIFRVFARSI